MIHSWNLLRVIFRLGRTHAFINLVAKWTSQACPTQCQLNNSHFRYLNGLTEWARFIDSTWVELSSLSYLHEQHNQNIPPVEPIKHGGKRRQTLNWWVRLSGNMFVLSNWWDEWHPCNWIMIEQWPAITLLLAIRTIAVGNSCCRSMRARSVEHDAGLLKPGESWCYQTMGHDACRNYLCCMLASRCSC